MTHVLILGSGPNVVSCQSWPKAPFDRIVAINNAWRVRPDWDDLIYPDDMDPARLPRTDAPPKRRITSAAYVPAQNASGGFVFGGGTMAFTAGYWALHDLRPKVMAYLGCDMVYPKTGARTHFYGTGRADPERKDVSLRSLEAKSARLMALAAMQDCAVVNLSADQSRLLCPRATPARLGAAEVLPFDAGAVAQVLGEEARLDYMVPSGRYWLEAERFDPDEIDRIDALWLELLAEAVARAAPLAQAS